MALAGSFLAHMGWPEVTLYVTALLVFSVISFLILVAYMQSKDK